jgi:8-oxo-dGTP pyrophosphatase MutT (NUDIX family)
MPLDPGRAALLADLERYVPSGDGERAMAERLRAFVAAHPDCFQRTRSSGHVTGSAWVVDRAGEAAVLTHHRKLGKWLQLGGHADGDSDIRRVALREAVEESGLTEIEPASDGIYDVDVHEIPARGAEPAHLHYDVRFAFYADRNALPAASEESHAVAWVPLAEIERFAIDDSVRRLAAKTRSLTTPKTEPSRKRTELSP